VTRYYAPPEALQKLITDAQDPRFIGTPFKMLGNEANSFGIRCGDGFAAVFGFDSDDQPTWWLRMAAGIALDVADIEGALRWVNEQNRGIYTGCYLCAIDQSRNLAAVVYQVSFSNIEINSDSELVFAFMTNMMTSTSKIAATQPAELIQKCGGVPFNEGAAYSLPMMV
jgi:hypothetical protein